MRSTRPPALAQWLLHHFGCSSSNSAIIGDMDERYRQGRSRGWYWKEALTAIVGSFLKEISTHKLAATRALLVGWTVKIAWLYIAMVAYILVFRSWLLLLLIVSVVVCALSARLVARVSGPHYRPMVLLYLVVELLAVPVKILLFDWSGSVFLSWASPISTFFAIVLNHFGYFSTVTTLWCGSAVMAVVILFGGGFFRAPAESDSNRREVITA